VLVCNGKVVTVDYNDHILPYLNESGGHMSADWLNRNFVSQVKAVFGNNEIDAICISHIFMPVGFMKKCFNSVGFWKNTLPDLSKVLAEGGVIVFPNDRDIASLIVEYWDTVIKFYVIRFSKKENANPLACACINIEDILTLWPCSHYNQCPLICEVDNVKKTNNLWIICIKRPDVLPHKKVEKAGPRLVTT
jgi:hypothetical protein